MREIRDDGLSATRNVVTTGHSSLAVRIDRIIGTNQDVIRLGHDESMRHAVIGQGHNCQQPCKKQDHNGPQCHSTLTCGGMCLQPHLTVNTQRSTRLSGGKDLGDHSSSTKMACNR